jgi:hypothetical protein
LPGSLWYARKWIGSFMGSRGMKQPRDRLLTPFASECVELCFKLGIGHILLQRRPSAGPNRNSRGHVDPRTTRQLDLNIFHPHGTIKSLRRYRRVHRIDVDLYRCRRVRNPNASSSYEVSKKHQQEEGIFKFVSISIYASWLTYTEIILGSGSGGSRLSIHTSFLIGI